MNGKFWMCWKARNFRDELKTGVLRNFWAFRLSFVYLRWHMESQSFNSIKLLEKESLMEKSLAKTKSFEQHCYFVDLAKELAI